MTESHPARENEAHTLLDRPVVVGAGPIARALVRQLAGSGHTPTVVTRSGSEIDGATTATVDVSVPSGAITALADASIVFQTAQPAYHRWTEEFRALQESILMGCEAAAVPLIVVDNVYGYGPTATPMNENTPLMTEPATRKGFVRAAAWRDLAEAHTSGRVACAAVRSSDFIGANVDQSVFGARFFRPLLAGKKAELLGPADVRHSATNVDDVAAAMIAVGRRPDTWGRAWHAPTAPAVTFREIIDIAADLAGVEPRFRTMPAWLLRVIGLFDKDAGEVVEMLYQFDRDFVVDSTRSDAELGLTVTPIESSVAQAVEWFSETS